MKASPKGAFLFLALLLLVEGCTHPPGEPVRPELISREEWIGRLEDRSRAWKSYEAQVRIHVESPKGRFSARAVVIANLPDQMRIEAFNPFGQTASLFILNRGEGKSGLLVPSERVLYTAGKPETLVFRLLGASVPLEALGYTLTACVPPEHIPHLRLLPQGNGMLGHAQPQRQGPTLTWQFLVSPPALKAFDVHDEAGAYGVRYDPAVELQPSAVPKSIRCLGQDWQMDVSVDRMGSLQATSAAAFQLTAPTGIRTVNLDRGL